MKGMIDGRRLKCAWDNRELGTMLLGEPPYEYEADADMEAYFTRMRQVGDFLQCRPPRERQRVLGELYRSLEASDQPWAKAAALFLKRALGDASPELSTQGEPGGSKNRDASDVEVGVGE